MGRTAHATAFDILCMLILHWACPSLEILHHAAQSAGLSLVLLLVLMFAMAAKAMAATMMPMMSPHQTAYRRNSHSLTFCCLLSEQFLASDDILLALGHFTAQETTFHSVQSEMTDDIEDGKACRALGKMDVDTAGRGICCSERKNEACVADRLGKNN